MLQISTGKFFRDVPLHETNHRRVLYTNVNFLGRSMIDLSVATLLPSNESKSVTTVTVEFVERLEAVRLDGTPEMMASTGGDQILDDLAFVLSFAFNATFGSDHDMVRRLIPVDLGSRGGRSSPARILRRTCDPGLFVDAAAIEDATSLIAKLMALSRESYEPVIRAIRQVVDACRRVAVDPTLSYTMFVAALEALSTGTSVGAVAWDALDGRKRKLLDAALDGVDEGIVQRVRSAVLEAERAGLKRRFKAFVLQNVSPGYFRREAVDATRPPSVVELTKALSRAYDVRSLNVHVLENLRPEALAFGERADLVNPAGKGLMLSLEGLNRLSRNVIRTHIGRGEAAQMIPFDYRPTLPNMLQAQWAPQYWISNASGLSKESARRYFTGFIDLLVETLRQPTSQSPGSDGAIEATHMPDLGPTLARIEELAPGLRGEPRLSLITIYVLWHRFFVLDSHRPDAAAFIGKFGGELEVPSMQSFVAACLCGEEPSWTLAEFQKLAEDDRSARSERNVDPLPNVFNAALAAEIAERLEAVGSRDEAIAMLSRAVEECPGNKHLIHLESDYLDGGQLIVDLRTLILGTDDAITESAAE